MKTNKLWCYVQGPTVKSSPLMASVCFTVVFCSYPYQCYLQNNEMFSLLQVRIFKTFIFPYAKVFTFYRVTNKLAITFLVTQGYTDAFCAPHQNFWHMLFKFYVDNNLIDLFHNGGQIKYSFVLMLISLTRLATMCKIQRKFCS